VRGLYSFTEASVFDESVTLLIEEIGLLDFEAGLSRLSEVGILEVEVAVL